MVGRPLHRDGTGTALHSSVRMLLSLSHWRQQASLANCVEVASQSTVCSHCICTGGVASAPAGNRIILEAHVV